MLILPLNGVDADEYYELEDLIEHGLTNSFEMQKDAYQEQNIGSQLRSSYLELLPSMNILYSDSKTHSRYGTFDNDDDIKMLTQTTGWSPSTSMSLSKSISFNDPTYYNIRHAHLDKESFDYTQVDRIKTVAFNIVSQFVSILEMQKRVEILQQNYQLQQNIYQQIEIQYNSGEKSLLELQQSEITMLDNEISLLEAENRLVVLRKDLFNYLNLDDEGLPFQEPEIELVEPEEIEFQENLNLKAMKNDLQKMELSRIRQKWDRYPSLSFGVSYNMDDGVSDELYHFSDYDRSYTFSLNISYPLFSFFEKREAYHRTNRNLKIQKINFTEQELNLKNNYSNLVDDLQTMHKALDIVSKKLQLAERSYDMAEEQYERGIISLIELDRAKLDLQNAQLAQNNRYWELIRKQEELNLLLSKNILQQW
jgi:outer membrane protein TolC